MLEKSKIQSFNDIREIIKLMIGDKPLINISITDKSGNKYRVMSCELKEDGILINKDMFSNEVKCNVNIPYDNIAKIEDRVNSVILFEDIS